MNPHLSKLNGVVPVDKPIDWTSADVVRKLKTYLPRGTKIGHAGTLDPNATGVLPILIGRATKLQDQLMKMEKSYEGVILLGSGTDTDDVRGAVIESDETFTFADRVADAQARLDALTAEFSGEYEQLPPQFSALKVDGQRAYDLARQGKQVELKPRTVRVSELHLEPSGSREIRFSVSCGSGFYVRSLARDLGKKLGTCGTLKELRRTSCGGFLATQSIELDQLNRDNLEGSMVRISRLIDPIDSPVSLR